MYKNALLAFINEQMENLCIIINLKSLRTKVVVLIVNILSEFEFIIYKDITSICITIIKKI